MPPVPPEQGREKRTSSSIYSNLSKIENSVISDRLDNILQHPKLRMPKNCRNIPENWLELEIFDLIKYPVKLHKFELYDKNNERLCICKFVRAYEKSSKLIGYFSKPIFCNYYSNLYGNMMYLRDISIKQGEKLSNQDEIDNIFISDTKVNIETIRSSINAVHNNIIYSQRITLLSRLTSGSAETLVNQNSNNEHYNKVISAVQRFFYDDPDLPWQPLPGHSLEGSLCYPIIGQNGKFYYCKLHPEVCNIYLESIEHHCKYKDPDVHKSEILKLLSAKFSANFAKGEM
jgi:hypothetical protein